MATLIAVYNSEGCVGRCDARCYNATTKVCDCICGGRNHGAGRSQAMQNTADMVLDREQQQALEAQFAQTHQLDRNKMFVSVSPRILHLIEDAAQAKDQHARTPEPTGEPHPNH